MGVESLRLYLSFALISFSCMFWSFLKAMKGGFLKILWSVSLSCIVAQYLLIARLKSLWSMKGLYVVVKTSSFVFLFVLPFGIRLLRSSKDTLFVILFIFDVL